MYAPRSPPRTSGRHRSNKYPAGITFIQNMPLSIRRARRICRPFMPIAVRALIVIFTVIELRPAHGHLTGEMLPFFSRLGVLAGFMASLLSIIFFDIRVFNFIIVGAVILKFVFDIITHEHIVLPKLIASVSFHSTAILFSALVGRRRSISKPSALRANVANDRVYFQSLKGLRHVDLLEAGTRLQASILALDYSLSGNVGSSGFFFTLPFAALFLAGYSTQRNGAILLIILFSFSVVSETSPILGFNFTKTASTVGGAMLGIFVGPGLLTVDEWLATAKQLCY